MADGHRNGEAVDTSVVGIALFRWGVRPEPAHERFEAPGWWYEEPAPLPCPRCGGVLHALRKEYDGPNRNPDKPSFLVAVVCPGCPATFTLQALKKRSYVALMDREEPPKRRQPRRPLLECDVPPGEMRVRSLTLRGDEVRQYVEELLGAPGPSMFARTSPPPEPDVVVERRLLRWCKITDPRAATPPLLFGVDVRVLLPAGPEFAELCARLHASGVPYRQVRYWLEAETISTVGERGALAPLWASAELLAVTNPARHRTTPLAAWSAAAARDAFEMMWDAHAQPPDTGWEPVPAAALVPEQWLQYLPFAGFNPAQAQAAPVVLGGRQHVVVTAPTGAGKTVVGMLAALKAILDEGRKAVWLVPQRSLTDELDRELATWRAQGLRVERLSGEFAIDAERVREADLWVATTEKFEAICRGASLRAALEQVGCLVVDEIHLLGDTVRGPLLEALLARVRGANSPVRIVGLSATAANADEVAGWLGAQLVDVTWRPSRLTWQLPLIPASSDRRAQNAARMRLATAITTMITADGGSVLVFCGSKRNVRATALDIAATRGAETKGVDPDDLARVHQICTATRVGIHYKDWDHKRDAERAFRDRDFDVLVATTTVAAGVNLPARAVVVRDTEIGVNHLNTATVQQMFGRAGRIGAGETEGWAYLIADENERPRWQARLVAGYTVTSHIADSLADHLLAEAAQDRIHTRAEAQSWWTSTLAYHQNIGTPDAVPAAIEFLIEHGYLTTVTRPDDIALLAVTDLGMLTTRLMVPVSVGVDIRAALADEMAPGDPHAAEQLVGEIIATLVPQLALAPLNEDLRPLVARLLRADGNLDRLDSTPAPGLVPDTACENGDLAQVAFALVANHPHLFTGSRRTIAGLPVTILSPILDEAPRYFHWLAAQGPLGTLHPWAAVVAADLGRRIRWRRLAPTRGAGRLLWICEHMATPQQADTLVPQLFTAARSRDVTNPDWPTSRPPRLCQLDDDAYLGLLRDRATDTTFADNTHAITVTCPTAATVVPWTDQIYQPMPLATAGTYPYPNGTPTNPTHRGATIFTRRGDHYSHGWLSAYNTIKA
ncbi:MAG: DEAD/DEAH box helicase [Labedaea sp.]